MNQHPDVLLDPLFRWLDDLIRDYGLYIFQFHGIVSLQQNFGAAIELAV